MQCLLIGRDLGLWSCFCPWPTRTRARQRPTWACLDLTPPCSIEIRAARVTAARDPPTPPLVAILPRREARPAGSRFLFCRGPGAVTAAGAVVEVVRHAPATALGALIMQIFEGLRRNRCGPGECRQGHQRQAHREALHVIALSGTGRCGESMRYPQVQHSEVEFESWSVPRRKDSNQAWPERDTSVEFGAMWCRGCCEPCRIRG